MANKENLPPPTPGRSGLRADGQCTPPGSSPGALGLRPWQMSAFASPPLRAMSPNSKPALSRQRDHSACGRPATPLKVRKTRENLKEASLYPDIPPPCVHASSTPPHVIALHPRHDGSDQHTAIDTPVKSGRSPSSTRVRSPEPTVLARAASDYSSMPPPPLPPEPIPTRMQRHKSVSRRMLSKVKQGISNRSMKAPPSIRPIESETSLMRRLSGRRKQSLDMPERRAQSFDISRQSSTNNSAEEVADAVLARVCPPARSFTDSTVSTTEALADSPSTSHHGPGFATPQRKMPSFSFPQIPSPSPLELTPRPYSKALPLLPSGEPTRSSSARNNVHVAVPYVDLAISTDCTAVNAGTAHDVWIAVEATVRSRSVTLSSTEPNGHAVLVDSVDTNTSTNVAFAATAGSIRTLRLCFKPADGCRLLDVVGQKSLKDLHAGQTCCLFVKVHVHELESQSRRAPKEDSATLFAELESIVGTLETDVLHVEARYRHSLLPSDNVVTVRHSAKIRRPRTESRWSIVGAPDESNASDEVHTKLAIHLADHYPPERALRLINRCLGAEGMHSDAVRQVRQTLLDDLERHHMLDQLEQSESAHSANKPSVVITDSDMAESCASSLAPSEQFSTAPCTPLAEPETQTNTMASALTARPRITTRSTSLNLFPPVPLSALTASKATSSINLPTANDLSPTDVQGDAARKVWQHIRRTSLSAKQVADLASEPLDATDEVLRELHRKALANKRSVGAETLKDWKWSGKVGQFQRAEAPWL
ncbi:hypothetical protein LTR08_007618 [Meristemomyces frigidus]|nr:hypothetical protein LTR08_007618 [Meristemomyces frigidus]